MYRRLNRYDLYDSCPGLYYYDGFLAGSVLALLSVIPNVLLLRTFAAARKRDKVLRMGAIHFGMLAVLDISYGLVDTIEDFNFNKTLGYEAAPFTKLNFNYRLF